MFEEETFPPQNLKQNAVARISFPLSFTDTSILPNKWFLWHDLVWEVLICCTALALGYVMIIM